jgi:hypothetical protein
VGKAKPRNGAKPFSRAELDALDSAKILGVRSGADHRYVGVWVVVVEDRVFVRTWNDEPTGWYRAFLHEPRGSIQVGTQEIVVRGRHARSERLRRLVTEAYAAKYPTKGSVRWVTGFADPKRESNTLELLRDR